MSDEFDEASIEALRRRHGTGLVARDNRRAMRSGRTAQLNVRVLPALKAEIEQLVNTRGLMICEVIERAIDALKREDAGSRRTPDASSH